MERKKNNYPDQHSVAVNKKSIEKYYNTLIFNIFGLLFRDSEILCKTFFLNLISAIRP